MCMLCECVRLCRFRMAFLAKLHVSWQIATLTQHKHTNNALPHTIPKTNTHTYKKRRHLQYISTEIAKDKLFFVIHSHPSSRDSVCLMYVCGATICSLLLISVLDGSFESPSQFTYSLSLFRCSFLSPLPMWSAGINNKSKLNQTGKLTHTHTHTNTGISWARECGSVCSQSHLCTKRMMRVLLISNCKSIVPFRSAGESLLMS